MKQIGLMAMACAALALAACDNGTTAPVPSSKGVLSVQLTDAPFPYDSVARVDLYVTRIDAMQANVDSAEAADVADSSSVDDTVGAVHKGWVTIATPKTKYNLLSLQNGTVANLGQVALPVGTYQGFRLILNTDSSSVTLKDGTVLTGTSSPGIRFPSAGRTGIKINLSSPIVIGGSGATMVLDFDLAHSFVMRGHTISQNGLLFKPVIKAVARDISASISGSVHADSATGSAVANAQVELLKNGTALSDTTEANVVASTKSDSLGNYKIAFVPAGTYELRATPVSGYSPALLSGTVTVAAGDALSGEIIVVKP